VSVKTGVAVEVPEGAGVAVSVGDGVVVVEAVGVSVTMAVVVYTVVFVADAVAVELAAGGRTGDIGDWPLFAHPAIKIAGSDPARMRTPKNFFTSIRFES